MTTIKIKQQHLSKALQTRAICILVCLAYTCIIALLCFWLSPVADSVREYFTGCLQGVTSKLNVGGW
ncbi:MAG: hypothetical protein ABJA37_07605 [Ferruginibacter sp.]